MDETAYGQIPISDLISLQGRVAVITGGADGIGFAIAQRMVEAGANVALADIDAAKAEASAAALRREGHEALGLGMDVGSRASVTAAVERLLAVFGGIDIWVNNAGLYPRRPLLELEAAEWERVLRVNLDGVLIGTQAAAGRMIEAGRGGVILNIESTAAFRSMGDGLAAYTASKHAAHGLTLTAARELGRHGIRVLGIAPTVVKTENYVSVARATAGDDSGAERRFQEIADLLPLGRPGVPDDIARVALFCASDLAAFMTGSTLLVDGGHLVK